MLAFHDCTERHRAIAADLASSALPPDVTWIDMFDGTPEEIAYIERATGRHVPTAGELNEIENSSRVRNAGGALFLSAPIVSRAQSGAPRVTGVGFVLTKDLLVTVRFAALTSFATFADSYGKEGEAKFGGYGAFAGLIDAVTDRMADVLEGIGADLDAMSGRIFSSGAVTPRQPPAREDKDLREILRRIGCAGDLASKIRDSLLGVGRIVGYTAGIGGDNLAPELRAQLETQRRDVESLAAYDEHLSSKVQLLLDATMGLINIEQNNIMKVLTVVSVVGVPPTLIAGIYGMNFKGMPEYNWTYGYPYGLTVIALSAILPLVWFKIKGWL